MLKTFSITDVGKKRQLNQDYVFTSECAVGNLPNIFIVADGMGGHNAGDFASKCTVETIVAEIKQCGECDPRKILTDAIEKANEVIRKKAQNDEALSGMGTTVVAAVCMDNMLLAANIGDSRLYIVHEQKMRQITKDHSLVEEMIQAGEIDRLNARTHPHKNIITRAVGAGDSIDIDFFQVPLVKNDMILMCSDGLTNMLEDEEIRMLLQGQRDIVEKAQELVKAANNNGGRDNIAVIIIEPCVGEVQA